MKQLIIKGFLLLTFIQANSVGDEPILGRISWAKAQLLKSFYPHAEAWGKYKYCDKHKELLTLSFRAGAETKPKKDGALAPNQSGIINEKPKQPVPNFTLKDADDISFSLSDTPDKPMILCFLSQTPDNKIGRYWMDENHRWINSLKKKYANEITVVTIKDMTNVPKWMPKSLVRKKLKGEPNRILIDWTGSVCHQYQIDNYFTLHILDSEMNIVYSTSEAYSDEVFDNVVETNKKILERGKQ